MLCSYLVQSKQYVLQQSYLVLSNLHTWNTQTNLNMERKEDSFDCKMLTNWIPAAQGNRTGQLTSSEIDRQSCQVGKHQNEVSHPNIWDVWKRGQPSWSGFLHFPLCPVSQALLTLEKPAYSCHNNNPLCFPKTKLTFFFFPTCGHLLCYCFTQQYTQLMEISNSPTASLQHGVYWHNERHDVTVCFSRTSRRHHFVFCSIFSCSWIRASLIQRWLVCHSRMSVSVWVFPADCRKAHALSTYGLTTEISSLVFSLKLSKNVYSQRRQTTTLVPN